MKKIIFILLLFPIYATAQTAFVLDEQGFVTYKKTVEVNATKDELYSRAKIWISNAFIDPKTVIKMDDKDSGVIKITFNTPFIDNYNLTSSMQIVMKDKKFQYTFLNIFVLTDPKAQNNLTAEGVLRSIKERTDKGKMPMKFLTDYIEVGDRIILGMAKLLTKAMETSDDF